ncbi:TPA: hypothetical protein RG697_003690 [Morganella morganii]|uniref:fimbrial protein n=1 Tax=Morganella morganii TaxID=582 RepID=UPI001BDB4592|nr:fimbrial protein [Morganella morganii]MBT0382718.1 hypothetical protein [Morganella morganii subsp. morganii]HDU8612025.1 hypothetical protein [Morganella morganii]
MKIIAKLFLIILLFPDISIANTVTCTPNTTWPGESANVNISGIVSIGEDAPIGTVIYSAEYTSQKLTGIVCSSEEVWPSTTTYIDLPVAAEINSAPLPVVPDITGPYGETVYKTNIPGIGVSVAIKTDGNSRGNIPYHFIRKSRPSSPGVVGGGSNSGFKTYIYVNLVKTGGYTSGTVDGSLFPSIKITFTDPVYPETQFVGFPFLMNTLNFSGQTQIITSTCNIITPHITVPLGSHDVSEFRGIGTYTEWKNASIELTGCKNFSPGFYSATSATQKVTGSGTFSVGPPDTRNRIYVVLSPVTGVISREQGIIALEPSNDTASGLGIQVGIDNNGTILPVPISSEYDLDVPDDSNFTLRIPLFARYIQTDVPVKAGTANSALIYTINYY